MDTALAGRIRNPLSGVVKLFMIVRFTETAPMNKRQFDRTPRREVTKSDVLAALESVLLAPRDDDSRDPKPDRADRDTPYRLDRRAP